MDNVEKDFQKIYGTVSGWLVPSLRIPWAENAFVEGTAYDQAYGDFWTARENLCARFGMEWGDEDLERFMNGIMNLSEDIARRMFLYGIEYARRGCKL